MTAPTSLSLLPCRPRWAMGPALRQAPTVHWTVVVRAQPTEGAPPFGPGDPSFGSCWMGHVASLVLGLLRLVLAPHVAFAPASPRGATSFGRGSPSFGSCWMGHVASLVLGSLRIASPRPLRRGVRHFASLVRGFGMTVFIGAGLLFVRQEY